MSENEIKNYVVIQNSKNVKKNITIEHLYIYIKKVLLFQLELYKILIF